MFGVLGFLCCCCITAAICRRRRTGQQTTQTVNKAPHPNQPHLVQMTANVQHNVVPNHMAYGNNMQNGSMRMHQNVMYNNGPRLSVVQQPMQQPVMHNMGQPVVVQAQHFQPQQPYGNNQMPIMMNQGAPVVVQAVQPGNVPRQSL